MNQEERIKDLEKKVRILWIHLISLHCKSGYSLG